MKKRTLLFAIVCAGTAFSFFQPAPSSAKLNFGRISAVKDKVEQLKDKKTATEAAEAAAAEAAENARNHDPVISSVTVAQAVVSSGSAVAITCFAADRDRDALTYTWSAASGAISGAGYAVNWVAPSSSGAYTIETEVTDGRGGSARAAVSVGVTRANVQPDITSLLAAPAAVSTGAVSAVTCLAADPDSDTLSYSWSAASGTLSGSGYTVNWIAPASSGTYTIEVSVSDGRGGSAQAAISIAALKGNLPPAIASLVSSSAILSTGTAVQLTCSASDPDGDALSYDWHAASGVISGVGPQIGWVAPASSGTQTVGVTVSDGHGGSALAAINLAVTQGDTPTVIHSVTPAPALISTGAATTIFCDASDIDGDPLSYAWSAASGTFAAFASTANPTTWIAPLSSGAYTVTVAVSDGHGGLVQASTSVAVYKYNNTPVIDSITSVPAVVSTGAVAALTCSVYDIDGDTLTYVWSAASGTILANNTSTAAWTAPDSTGSYTVTVTVTDGQGGSAQSSVSMGVYFWKTYTTANSGIAADYVRSIAVGPAGDAWFGSWENGVSRLSGGAWTVYSYVELGSNSRPMIAVDASGAKWVATWGGGLAKYDGAWTPYNTMTSSLTDDFIRSIGIDQAGNKWLGSYTHGLLKFDGVTTTSYTVANTGGGLTDNTVLSIAFDTSGNKWFGTNSGGVSKFTGSAWTNYTMSNSGLPGNMVRGIAVDSTGYKWFATSGGAAMFDGGGYWQIYNTANSGLLNDTVNGVAVDAAGNKWFATSGGVSKFDGSAWTNYTTANSGLLDNVVLAVTVDAAGNKWFGTNTGGVTMYAGE